MRKNTHADRLKMALEKFEVREAERALDLLADDEDKGYAATSKEEGLRERLIKCLEAYERTMSSLDR